MKKQLFFISLLFICLPFFTNAQENIVVGARQTALGGVGLFGNDIWMSSSNQAGLANLDAPMLGTYYNNKFQIKELRTLAFAGAYPVKNVGTFGFNYTQFGYEVFRQSKFAFAYAKQLGKRVSMGISLDYFQVRQNSEYGKKGFVTGEIGIIVEPVDNLYVAAHIFNPWVFNIKQNEIGELNSVFSLGMGYKFSDKVLVAIEADKDIEQDLQFRFGTEYEIIENLFLRVGMSTAPAEYSFGVGYSYKGVIINCGLRTHNTLGMQYSFGLNYSFADLFKKD